MDLSFNLAPSYRDLKDPTTRQNFDDTVEQKRVIDLRACHFLFLNLATRSKLYIRWEAVMPVYMYHFATVWLAVGSSASNWCLMNFYINTTNLKGFEKYKIMPIDAKIVSYFLNNSCS